jgi:hypothetical protein
MKRPKGPELKMPEMSVPPVLADLFYDLRDRRLLPLVVLVVVAIVAVPFLLGSSREPVPPAPTEAATATGSAAADAATIAVVQAKPGLRDYRKRLADRSPADPFRQHYTTPDLTGAELPDAESSSGSSSATTYTVESSSETTTTTSESGSSPGTSGGAPSGGGDDGAPQLIEFVFDVQISHSQKTADGGQKMSEPEVRHDVRTLDQLPGKKIPVVTMAGLNLHNGKVWFLVSDDVHSLDGDFACVTRTPDGLCELVEVEPGFPLELVYEPNEEGADKVVYRIKVVNIDAVAAGKVGDDSRSSRASFGRLAVSARPTG